MQFIIDSGQTVLIDAEDYEKIKGYKWRIMNGYAVRSVRVIGRKYTKVYMHRQIMSAEKGVMVDHKNHDRLDNRKENLRFANHQLNGFNRRKLKPSKDSSYKGVKKSWSRWAAVIRYCGKNYHIGTFATEKEAAIAYNKKAKELFKDFCNLNVVK